MDTVPSPALTARPHPRARWRRAAAAALFATTATVVTAHTLARENVPGAPERAGRNGLQDFRDAVYYPVRALLDGRNPYDPSEYLSHYPVASAFPLYSPALLTVHLPVGWLVHDTAQRAYYALHLALLPAFAWLTLQLAGRRGSAAAVLSLATALLLSRPGQHNAFLGQCTLTVALGAYAALRWGASRPGLAALGFALTTLKPTYALPLGVLLLCRGEGRPVGLGTLFGAAAAVPAAAALLRHAETVGAALGENLDAFAANAMVDPTTSLYRVDAVVPLAHLLGAAPQTGTQLAWAGLLLLPAGWAVRCLAARHDGAARRAANELICLAVLTTVYHLTYDALLLALPAAALVLGSSGLAPRTRPWARAALGALLLVPAFNYLATETAVAVLGLPAAGIPIVASLNAYACLAAFVLGLVLARRRAAERRPADDETAERAATRTELERCLPA